MLKWKNNSNGKTALLIDGARRVGKSFIAEEFAKNNYKSYILLDFNKVPTDIKNLFDNYLDDLDTLFLYLYNYYNVKLYERETLIIFDEVQLYPRARSAIKYLVEDGRYDYIETRSLVSIRENFENILIPSEEQHIKMYPFDYNGGMIIENIVAQMLTANNHKLFFYSNSSRENSEDRMEIDFLISKSNITNRHNISPIEVKSGKNYTLVSMNKFIKKYKQKLSTPYVIHTGDLKEENGILYIPLYMTTLL